ATKRGLYSALREYDRARSEGIASAASLGLDRPVSCARHEDTTSRPVGCSCFRGYDAESAHRSNIARSVYAATEIRRARCSHGGCRARRPANAVTPGRMALLGWRSGRLEVF